MGEWVLKKRTRKEKRMRELKVKGTLLRMKKRSEQSEGKWLLKKEGRKEN